MLSISITLWAAEANKIVQQGKVTINALTPFWSSELGVEIEDNYSAYLDVKHCKNESRTYFLDKMREQLNKRMERNDEREQAKKYCIDKRGNIQNLSRFLLILQINPYIIRMMKKLYFVLKKDMIIALLIAVVSIAIAYIINLALTYGNFIPTVISNDTWLAFWGGYCGGIFALIIGYLAIRHSNRNSEKAIYQQNALLKKQHEEKNLDSYNECLKNNLKLLNVADAVGIVANINSNDIASTKTAILHKKSLIYAYDLQYRYISKIDLLGFRSETERQYFDCWNEAQTQLSQLLDLQLSLVQRIQQNHSDYKTKEIYQQLLVNTRQLLSSLKQMGCNEDNDEYQHSQKELTNIQNNLKVIDSQINTYISDIDSILKNTQPVYFALLDKSKHLFDLSVSLIEEQEKRLNY